MNISSGQGILVGDRGTQINHFHSTVQDQVLRLFEVPHVRNPFFTGREDILSNVHGILKDAETAQRWPVALSGLGGIGKTQTAVEYCYRYIEEYKSIIWLRAESEAALDESISLIVPLLNLSINGYDIAEARLALFRWLRANEGWLVVLDNVNDPKVIESFLPGLQRGHILITTRQRDLRTIAIMANIYSLSEEHSILFLLRRSSLIGQYDSAMTASVEQQLAALELSRRLQGLPLALEQAGAYLAAKQAYISDYIAKFEIQEIKLLERQAPQTGEYLSTVATTWKINFDAVTLECSVSAKILLASAFVAPDEIPEELVLRIISDIQDNSPNPSIGCSSDPLTINELLEPLARYSLIRRNPDRQTYNIHRLVQAVIQSEQSVSERRQWQLRTIVALAIIFPEPVPETRQLSERLISHVQTCRQWMANFNICAEPAALFLMRAAGFLSNGGRFDGAEELYNAALEMFEFLHGKEGEMVAACLLNLSKMYEEKRDYKRAEQCTIRALTITKKNGDGQLVSILDCRSSLAIIYLYQGRIAEAQDHIEAIMKYEEFAQANSPSSARALSALGGLYERQGKPDLSADCYERALNISKQFDGPDASTTAVAMDNLGCAYMSMGRVREAEGLCSAAASILEANDGIENTHTVKCLNNVASIYIRTLRLSDAERVLRPVCEKWQRAIDSGHLEVSISLQLLGNTLAKLGQNDEAVKWIECACAVKENFFGASSIDILQDIVNLAGMYDNLGLLDKAKSAGKRSVTICEDILGSNHLQTIEYMQHLSEFYIRRDYELDALRLLEEIVNRKREVFDANDISLASSLNRLAEVMEKADQLGSSENAYAEAQCILKISQGENFVGTRKVGEHLARVRSKLAHK